MSFCNNLKILLQQMFRQKIEKNKVKTEENQF